MSYRTTLEGWHDFYSITGTAAASLVGLLFVGLSLHLRLVVSRRDVRGLARVTLTSFGLTLLVSLIMVIPADAPAATGQELIGSGIAACLLIIPSLIAGARSRQHTLGFRRVLLRFGLSAVSFLGVIATGGVLVAGGYKDGLGWLVVAVIVLLLLPCGTPGICW